MFAIVLAAGTASRFGSTKQLALFDGEPLVRHSIRIAEAACGTHTVLVVGHDWQRVHAACAPLSGFLVRNEAYASGMASSIAAGVRAVAGVADAVLLLLADQPGIGAADLGRLIAASDRSQDLIACSSYAGAIGPPAIFPATCFAELVALRGDRGARQLLQIHADRLVRVPCEAAADDVDTPDDISRIRNRAGAD